jgi:multicomponent Na+:H+ antiporter subunit E
MNLFFINTFVALAYMGVQGRFTLSGFAVGFTLGYLALWITQPLYGESRYFKRFPKTIRLAGFFLLELFLSSLRVFGTSSHPDNISRPELSAFPLTPKQTWRSSWWRI